MRKPSCSFYVSTPLSRQGRDSKDAPIPYTGAENIIIQQHHQQQVAVGIYRFYSSHLFAHGWMASPTLCACHHVAMACIQPITLVGFWDVPVQAPGLFLSRRLSFVNPQKPHYYILSSNGSPSNRMSLITAVSSVIMVEGWQMTRQVLYQPRFSCHSPFIPSPCT